MVHDCFKIFQAISEIQPEPPKSIKIQDKQQRKKNSPNKLSDENQSIIIPLEQNQQIILEQPNKQLRIKKSLCSCLPIVQRKQNQIKSAKYLQYLKSVETCPVHGDDGQKIEQDMHSSAKPQKKVRITEPQEKPSTMVSHQIQKLKSPEKGILINAKNKTTQLENQYDIEDEIFSTDQKMDMIPEKNQLNVFGPPSSENGPSSLGNVPSQPSVNLFGPKINKLLDFNTEGQTKQFTTNLVQENIPQRQFNISSIILSEPQIKTEQSDNQKIVNQPTINFGQQNAELKNNVAFQEKINQDEKQIQKNQEEPQQSQMIENEQKIEMKPQGSGIFSQIGQLGTGNSISIFGSLNLQNLKVPTEVPQGQQLNTQDSQKLEQSQIPLGNQGFFANLSQLGQLGSQKQNINDGILGIMGQGTHSSQGTQNQIQQSSLQQISPDLKQTPSLFSNLGSSRVPGDQGNLGNLGNLGNFGNQGVLANQRLSSNSPFGNLGTLGTLGSLGQSNQSNQQPQFGTLGILGSQQNGNTHNQINLSQLAQSFSQSQPQQVIQDIFNYSANPTQNAQDIQNPANLFNSYNPPPAPAVNTYQLGQSRYINQKTPPKREQTRIE